MTWGKNIGGLLIGMGLLLGALLVLQWGYQKYTGKALMGAAVDSVTPVSSENNGATAPVPITAPSTASVPAEGQGQTLQTAGYEAPCVIPPLPVSSCGCPDTKGVNVDQPSRFDLYPGSYTSFAYATNGCNNDPRNKRC